MEKIMNLLGMTFLWLIKREKNVQIVLQSLKKLKLKVHTRTFVQNARN